MPRRRGDTLETNFDGLTDSVTNLVGALVLLVILVIAATTPSVGGVDTPPPPDNTLGEKMPMDQLLESIRRIKLDARQVDAEINRVENRLPEIRVELQELQLKVKSAGENSQGS